MGKVLAIRLDDTAALHCMEEKNVAKKRAVAFAAKQSYDYMDVPVRPLQEPKSSLSNMSHRGHKDSKNATHLHPLSITFGKILGCESRPLRETLGLFVGHRHRLLGTGSLK